MNNRNNFKQIEEKNLMVFNGFIIILIITFLASLLYLFKASLFIWVGFTVLTLLTCSGFFILNPNQAMVTTFFGTYSGSHKVEGFSWMNPLNKKSIVSLKIQNYTTQTIKVNDKSGNPVDVATTVTWRVSDSAKNVFGVEDCVHFLELQSEVALRKIASEYSYDDEENQICLRSNGEEIAKLLKESIQRNVVVGGIQIIDARFTHLSYSAEIASVMLKKQQAQAIILARKKIVESAVEMVDKVLQDVEHRNLAQLDENQKAYLISNLMVVLVSDKDAVPTIQLQKA